MDQQMNSGDGMNQTWDTMTHQHAVQSGMDGHWEKFDNPRNGYDNAVDLWNDHCGGPPPHPEWAVMRERTPGDAFGVYQQNRGQPMPAVGPSVLRRIGRGALGVVGAAGHLTLSPFEGPCGAAAAGAATVTAFGLAVQ